MTRRQITDWHSHIWLPEHVSDWGRELDAKYSHNPSQSGSPEEHAEAMEEAGIDRFLIVGLVSRHLNLAVPNDFIADYARRSDGRGVGLAGIDPNEPDAVDEVKRCAEELGLRGVKLAPPYQNFHPHSPEAFRVYDEIARQGMFIMFHQGAVTHRMGVLEVANPILLDRVAREYPETRIVIAHMGQPWSAEVIPLMRKHPNLFADLSARCTRRNQLRTILKLVIDYGLEEKIVWGSDFPTFVPKDHAAGLLSAADTDEGPMDETRIPLSTLEDILYNRPLSLIGLPE